MNSASLRVDVRSCCPSVSIYQGALSDGTEEHWSLFYISKEFLLKIAEQDDRTSAATNNNRTTVGPKFSPMASRIKELPYTTVAMILQSAFDFAFDGNSAEEYRNGSHVWVAKPPSSRNDNCIT